MNKIWTEAEEKILTEKYPRYGMCCLEHLPNKTKRQVENKVKMLGIGIEGVHKSKGGVKQQVKWVEGYKEHNQARDEVYVQERTYGRYPR